MFTITCNEKGVKFLGTIDIPKIMNLVAIILKGLYDCCSAHCENVYGDSPYIKEHMLKCYVTYVNKLCASGCYQMSEDDFFNFKDTAINNIYIDIIKDVTEDIKNNGMSKDKLFILEPLLKGILNSTINDIQYKKSITVLKELHNVLLTKQEDIINIIGEDDFKNFMFLNKTILKDIENIEDLEDLEESNT